jgi:hypothetical protein
MHFRLFRDMQIPSEMMKAVKEEKIYCDEIQIICNWPCMKDLHLIRNDVTYICFVMFE